MHRILYICVILVAGSPGSALAIELFGVELVAAAQSELRAAVKQAGAELVSEADEEVGYDVYDSTSMLAGSTLLFLGFVRADQQFAFAEYEFTGLNLSGLLKKLKRKYGKPEISGGRYVSDRSYHWELGGIKISLKNDWQNYKHRLIYTSPDNLARLQLERSKNSSKITQTAEVSVF